jgi:16S rRNA (uracil1498-N3)-methyltransferase
MNERPGRIHRLFVHAELRSQASFELPEATAHHAARVLRLRDGESVVLFDGRGGEFTARLELSGRGRVLAETGERRDIERESPLSVILIQTVSSGEKMDFTVQKAVELGVAAIHPVLSDKAVVRLSDDRGGKKLEHWRRVAIAACEQCGRNRIPDIAAPVPLERYRAPEGAKIVLSPSSPQKLSVLANGPLALAVGPEAGFSEAEEKLLQRSGFLPASLGPRILRTETAGLAALAALNALAGDF